jgi:hypothetical protein
VDGSRSSGGSSSRSKEDEAGNGGIRPYSGRPHLPIQKRAIQTHSTGRVAQPRTEAEKGRGERTDTQKPRGPPRHSRAGGSRSIHAPRVGGGVAGEVVLVFLAVFAGAGGRRGRGGGPAVRWGGGGRVGARHVALPLRRIRSSSSSSSSRNLERWERDGMGERDGMRNTHTHTQAGRDRGGGRGSRVAVAS